MPLNWNRAVLPRYRCRVDYTSNQASVGCGQTGHQGARRIWDRLSRITFAISEAEEMTQRKSKTADRALRLHRFVIGLLTSRLSLLQARVISD